MEENNQFLQQFGGSATANLVSAIIFMIYKFIEGRCKHSKCSSNTRCFKCSADNYETKRCTSNPYNNKEDDIQPQSRLQELQRIESTEVQTRHSPTIEIRETEGRDHTRDFELVKEP